MMTLRILLADDNGAVLKMLDALLEGEGFDVVATPDNGETAVRLSRVLQPDVIVLDLGMPRVNGLDAARDIREVSPSTQVIILSGHCTGDLVKRAFRAGARGYVVKSDRAQELVRAIREVANGGIYLSPGASRSVVEGYLPDSDR